MSPDERWLPVVGEVGYLISDHGQLWSSHSKRILRGSVTRDGYRAHCFGSRGRQRRERFAHWMVLEAFVGPRPAGAYGCHRDDVPLHDTLSNLYWGTPVENARDRVRNGHDAQLRRTHCPRGHPLVLGNLKPYDLARGKRSCWACQKAFTMRSNQIKRGQSPIDIEEYADMKYAELVGQA